MPIYAYKCGTCSHADDVMQKMSDPVLTVCPACGAETYTKQLTAPGFALKGSGWYVTDFRGGNSGAPKADGEAKSDGKVAASGDVKRDTNGENAKVDASPALETSKQTPPAVPAPATPTSAPPPATAA